MINDIDRATSAARTQVASGSSVAAAIACLLIQLPATAQVAGAASTVHSSTSSGREPIGAIPSEQLLAVTSPGEASETLTKSPRIEEVLVVAQRRQERLLDVPIALTALPAAALETAGIENTRELSQLVPGLFVSQSGQYATITLRGISTEQIAPGSENNTAIYLDGAYLPSKIAGIFEFPDVESIEVLKGPQGTLYGRNATGGAILFRTRDPSYTFRGKATVGYGSLDDRLAKGFVTGPLIPDLLAGSLSAYYEKKDGYQKNLVTGDDHAGGLESLITRGKLMLTPSDEVKLILAASYADRDDKDSPLFAQPPSRTFGSNGLLLDPNAINATEPRTVATRIGGYNRNKTWTASFTASLDTAYGNLSSISAYTDISGKILSDGTYTSANGSWFEVDQPETVFTQDFTFASRRFGRIQYLAGLSYFHDVSKFDPVHAFFGPLGSPPVFRLDVRVGTEAMAGYVETDMQVTDELSFVAGVRYTHETKKLSGSIGPGTFDPVSDESWSRATPRASIKYKLSDETNVYATFSRGFKSGQYNSSTLSPVPVDPEDVDGYEVGIKSNVTPMLSIDASLFYAKYRDIQVSVATLNPITQNFNLPGLVNAAAAKIYGMDIDVTFRPIDDLTLQLRATPLHAKYTSFPDGAISVPIPLAFCPPTAQTMGCGGMTAFQDLSDNRLVKAPKISGSLAIGYTLHPEIGDIDLNTNLYMTDKFYWDTANLLEEPAYSVLNARVSWKPKATNLKIDLWGKNLTDETYFLLGSAAGGLWAPGRTYGISGSVEF